MVESENLTNKEKEVIEKCGTEPPFSSELLEVDEEGIFECKKCGQKLFSTKEKFKSGTGWPSFWDTIKENAIETRPDNGRTEVICSKCGAHLGHVFKDGPEDKTGKRYCINGIALKFKPKKQEKSRK